jgi:DNA-binding XRE family transcriptional regulator
MNPTTLRLSESFELTKSSEPTAKVGSAAQPTSTRPLPVLKVVAAVVTENPIPPGYRTLDSMVADLERDPKWRRELKSARSWMAETVLAGKPVTLRTLRLQRGMSQAQLAEAIGTQQPYIARIETGSADLRLETCRRLAAAMGIDLNTLDQALQGQRVLKQ